MCQLLFSETANPPDDVLKYANKSNPHGFGYAWVVGSKVRWSKGFEKEDFDAKIGEYLSLPFPKAIHFRYATHGGISPGMTHPFPIKRGVPLDTQGEANSVLFHNGVWTDYDDRLREAIFAGTLNPNILKGGVSDSRAMAILCQRFGEDILDVLNIYSQKVLILRHDTWYTYGSWTDNKEGWQASSSKLLEPVKSNVTGKWEPRPNVQPRQGVFLVPEDRVRQSMYLEASRSEIEQYASDWERNR